MKTTMSKMKKTNKKITIKKKTIKIIEKQRKNNKKQ